MIGVGFDITQPVRLEQKDFRECVGSIDADHTRIAGVVHDLGRACAAIASQTWKRTFSCYAAPRAEVDGR